MPTLSYYNGRHWLTLTGNEGTSGSSGNIDSETLNKINNLLISIGDLNNLKTNNKNNIVNAINEIYNISKTGSSGTTSDAGIQEIKIDDSNHLIFILNGNKKIDAGDISNIIGGSGGSGSNKAKDISCEPNGFKSQNVQAALEELFQFANDYKKSVAEIIGDPIQATDNAHNLRDKILRKKMKFAEDAVLYDIKNIDFQKGLLKIIEDLIKQINEINETNKKLENEKNKEKDKYDKDRFFKTNNKIFRYNQEIDDIIKTNDYYYLLTPTWLTSRGDVACNKIKLNKNFEIIEETYYRTNNYYPGIFKTSKNYIYNERYRSTSSRTTCSELEVLNHNFDVLYNAHKYNEYSYRLFYVDYDTDELTIAYFISNYDLKFERYIGSKLIFESTFKIYNDNIKGIFVHRKKYIIIQQRDKTYILSMKNFQQLYEDTSFFYYDSQLVICKNENNNFFLQETYSNVNYVCKYDDNKLVKYELKKFREYDIYSVVENILQVKERNGDGVQYFIDVYSEDIIDFLGTRSNSIYVQVPKSYNKIYIFNKNYLKVYSNND